MAPSPPSSDSEDSSDSEESASPLKRSTRKKPSSKRLSRSAQRRHPQLRNLRRLHIRYVRLPMNSYIVVVYEFIYYSHIWIRMKRLFYEFISSFHIWIHIISQWYEFICFINDIEMIILAKEYNNLHCAFQIRRGGSCRNCPSNGRSRLLIEVTMRFSGKARTYEFISIVMNSYLQIWIHINVLYVIWIHMHIWFIFRYEFISVDMNSYQRVVCHMNSYVDMIYNYGYEFICPCWSQTLTQRGVSF